MSKQTLRELAKDYAKGTIGKENYRKSRTELIQNIISDKVAVKPIDYVEPLKPPSNVDDAITEGINRDRDTTKIASQNNQKPESVSSSVAHIKKPEKNTKSPNIFIIVSIIIVLFLILAVFLFYPEPPDATVVDSSDNSSSVTNSPSAIESSASNSVSADTLIGNFLNEKNWGEENLNKFVASWKDLTQEEKDASTDSKRMQSLKAAIYKQFLEGKALASIDSEKATVKQQQLIEFAKAIGINDSKLIID